MFSSQEMISSQEKNVLLVKKDMLLVQKKDKL